MNEMDPEIPRLQSIEGAGDGGPWTPSGVGADEALHGFAITGSLRGGLERRRLAPVVAGALRVAVDHLTAGGPSGPLQVVADEAALEVRIDRIEPSGIAPAGEVLESVEAHLGVVPDGGGAWMIRVPLLTPNETFLLIEQGSLALAVPWHAVVRMRITDMAALARSAEQEGYAILPPLAPLSDPLADLPVVLLGLGLRRAYVVADQIIWRMPAEPTDEAAPRGHGLGPMVRTHEGRAWVMLDSAHLLRDVPPPPLPHVDSGTHDFGTPWRPEDAMPAVTDRGALPAATVEAPPEPVAPPALTVLSLHDVMADPEDAEALPAEPTEAAPAPVFPPGPPVLRLVELSRADVEPLVEPLPAPRALIAEDSMVAAIFLTRLLEQEGFVVVPVGTAAELHRLSAAAHWSLVFADVELPDAVAGRALAGLEPKNAQGKPATVIALVRDAEDAAHAGAYGVLHVLAKPFEAESLLTLLGELGFRR